MAALGAPVVAAPPEADADRLPEKVEFNRDIRPIVSNHCFHCHGPDEGQREAGLRLDLAEGAFEDRGGYQAILPGKPDESEVIRRITHEGDDRMPPPDHADALSGEQIALIERWIKQGAEYQDHWAFLPPRRPDVPDVGEADFVRNPIDRFILAELRSQGLEPSDEADRRTLIRRASFDITGLPPTPEQVEAFVEDDRPGAYERMIEQLLTSPHYGERMAIHWLDLVRYADTVGYHGDQPMSVWPYRDYVIEAFNANMPYDRFTIEQLAGDLLDEPTREQKVASGYNRLNMITAEGGAQAKEYLAMYAADRVRTTSVVWLGATLGCAECHDHKFDPYTARDFYSFAAFFADLKERGVYGGAETSGQWGPQLALPSEEQEAELAQLEGELDRLREVLDTHTPELAEAQAEWERSLAEQGDRWRVWRPVRAESENGATLAVVEDGSIRATGENPERDLYTLTVELGEADPPITAIRLEVLADDALPSGGPGRADNGNFVLNTFEAKVGDGEPIEWSKATATHAQGGWGIAGVIDGKDDSGWAILNQTGQANHAVFEAAEDITAAADGRAELTLTLRFDYGSRHTLGRFRLSATDAPRPVRAAEADEATEEVREILAADPEQRTEEQRDELAAHYRSIAPLLEPTQQRLAEVEAELERLNDQIPTTLISVSVEPREMRILPRGNWMDDSGKIVEPATPAFLGELGTEGRATRLDLARWLVSRDNPLTARAFVNRLWAMYFGEGLSGVLDDLGSQGEWPTHPELLDWLAVEFMDSGWDVQHVVKLIVMSGTYRQASLADERLRRHDPYNRLLARQSRFLLDAEMVRDNALAISGLLSPTIGGRSVRPYQPAGYYDQLNFPKREYEVDEGENLYRRGVYTHWQRTFLHPSVMAFDAPSREECTAKRARSNTPIQSLVLLNDPIYVEAARALAERMMREARGEEGRVRYAFRFALAREADPAELELLVALYRDHLDQYRAEPSAAEALLAIGAHPAPDDLDATELAAWTSVARTILNLHETITRD